MTQLFSLFFFLMTLSSPLYAGYIEGYKPSGKSMAIISVGTFGPITLRHEEIFNSLLSEMEAKYPGYDISIFVIANDMTLHKRGNKRPLELQHRVQILKQLYKDHPKIYVLSEPRTGAFARIASWIRLQSDEVKIFGHVGADSFVGFKNRIGAYIMKWMSPRRAQIERWVISYANVSEKQEMTQQEPMEFAGKAVEFISTPTELPFDIHATDVRSKYWLLNKGYPLTSSLDIPMVSETVDDYIQNKELFSEQRYQPKDFSLCSLLFL